MSFRCPRFAAFRAPPPSRTDVATGLSADTLAFPPEDVEAPQTPLPSTRWSVWEMWAPTLFIHCRHSQTLSIQWRRTPPGKLRKNMLGRPPLHAHTTSMRTRGGGRTQATQQSAYALHASSWFHSTKLRELTPVVEDTTMYDKSRP
jgi:hypothetical protein